MKANGNEEHIIKDGNIVKETGKEWRTWYIHSTSIDEISDRGTVHVNCENNVHNHEIKSLNCLYVKALMQGVQ